MIGNKSLFNFLYCLYGAVTAVFFFFVFDSLISIFLYDFLKFKRTYLSSVSPTLIRNLYEFVTSCIIIEAFWIFQTEPLENRKNWSILSRHILQVLVHFLFIISMEHFLQLLQGVPLPQEISVGLWEFWLPSFGKFKFKELIVIFLSLTF